MFRHHVELYLHVVWSTWDRVPWLGESIRARVHAVVHGVARRGGGSSVTVGGVADHVHVLLRAPPTIEPARLIGELKGVSSRFAHAELGVDRALRWSEGYALFSVDPTGVAPLQRYIERQAEHHAEGSLDPRWELPEAPAQIAAPTEPIDPLPPLVGRSSDRRAGR